MRFFIRVMAIVALAGLPMTALAYNYPGYKWGVNTVGWDTASLYIGAWRTAATDAMNSWNGAGAKFVMVNYGGSKNTMANYWEKSRVLAYAQRYREYGLWGKINKAIVRVNTYQPWNIADSSGLWYDLRSVLRHELGHTVPLDHVSYDGYLMYPETHPYTVTGVTSDERSGIRAIYGVR